MGIIGDIVVQGWWRRYGYTIPLFYDCYMRYGPHLTVWISKKTIAWPQTTPQTYSAVTLNIGTNTLNHVVPHQWYPLTWRLALLLEWLLKNRDLSSWNPSTGTYVFWRTEMSRLQFWAPPRIPLGSDWPLWQYPVQVQVAPRLLIISGLVSLPTLKWKQIQVSFLSVVVLGGLFWQDNSQKQTLTFPTYVQSESEMSGWP